MLRELERAPMAIAALEAGDCAVPVGNCLCDDTHGAGG